MVLVLNKPSARFLGAMYLCAVLVGVLVVFVTHAYQADFSGADEPSHFLNGYFIADYIARHFGGNPMGAATEFYIHYPKISIGHWPPAYYGMLGLLFLVLPPTLPVAFAINVLFAALPAIGVAAALVLLGQRRAAAVAGVLVYALTPLALEGDAMFMVDQPLTACLVAATAVWIAYAQRPTWGRAIGFALLAATAVLMKGNGWLVGLVPVFHIFLTGSWKLLRSVKLYVAAALAALLVVPWYMLTAKIAADGFNYHAGIDYALKALGANLHTLVQNLTPVGALLALVGIAAEVRDRRQDPLRWTIVSGLLSLPLATLVLQSVVPVDITERYMAPALPAVVVLAILGAAHLATHLLAQLRPANRPQASAWFGAALALVMAVPGILHLAQRTPKADAGLAQVARQLSAGHPVLTVIDGNAAYEGTFIADMAVHDRRLTGYVVRSSKLLADSDFMGKAYTLKFQAPRQVAAELNRLGVQHVVIVRADNRPAYPHSEQMRAAVLLPDSGFRLSQRMAHRFRTGTTEVYDAVGVTRPAIADVRNLGVPSKALPLTKLQ